MTQWPKGIRNFLLITAILFLLAHVVFHECQDLIAIEMILPISGFENPDPGDMDSDQQDQSLKFESNNAASTLFLAANPINQVSDTSFPLSANPQASVLRC